MGPFLFYSSSMKILNLLPLLALLSFSTFAQVSKSELSRNKIILVSDNVDERDLEDFMKEFAKFPIHLNQEIIKKGGSIHLIHGNGVSDDPSWKSGAQTFDGRGWENVPGGGGVPRIRRPTRIVVNRLYDGHGSINLFLHEQAHTLDYTYKDKGVSNSQVWKDLMTKNENINSYLRKCGRYCNENENERFAELFAIYHHSAESRAEMIQMLPEVADYFRNLTSIKKATNAKIKKK